MPGLRALQNMPNKHCWLLALAAFASCLPVFLVGIGGDVLFHYALIECFARGVWSGNLYPRWCFEADGGMGSPAFFFYFPFSYWMSSIFYPLRWLGAGTNSVHAMACLAASLVTAYGAYSWLRRFAAPGAALMGAVVFLYVPYRMDVLLYRAAYAEVWGMALLPWILAAFYDAAREQTGAWQRLAMLMGLLLLTHVPLAFVVIVGGGIYLLRAGQQSLLQRIKGYAGVGVMAFTLSAFYLLPAFYYRQFTHVEDSRHVEKLWANNHLSIENITEHGQGRLVVALGLMLLAAATLALWTYRKRAVLTQEVRREAGAWGVMLAVATFLVLPISDPFWALLKPIQFIALPWRQQALIAAALAYFVAIYGSFLMSERKLKTARGDAAGIIGLLVLLSLFTLSMRDSDMEPEFRQIVELQHISPDEYRTRWTEERFYSEKFVVARHENGARAEILSGAGVASVKEWNGDIVISIKAFSPVMVRIAHRYFPLWNAKDNGKPLTVRPEPNTGWMVTELPSGPHLLQLRINTLTGHLIFIMSLLASIVGWVAELAGWWQRRHKTK